VDLSFVDVAHPFQATNYVVALGLGSPGSWTASVASKSASSVRIAFWGLDGLRLDPTVQPTFDVTVTHPADASFVASPIVVVPLVGTPTPPTGSLSTLALLNCGGPTIGPWKEDVTNSMLFEPGSRDGDQSNTTDIYRTARWAPGGGVGYAFPAKPNRSYIFRLHFAEMFFQGVGQRVIVVRMGATVASLVNVLTGIDVIAEVGARFIGVVRTAPFFTGATGTGILMRVTASVDAGAIAALEMYDMGPA
jgi:hypothetical protein